MGGPGDNVYGGGVEGEASDDLPGGGVVGVVGWVRGCGGLRRGFAPYLHGAVVGGGC